MPSRLLACFVGSWEEVSSSMVVDLQPREEFLEKRIVDAAAFGVILHSASEGIFLQMYLLDDAIVSGPGFHFQIVSEPLDGLVMRAVHF